MDEALSCYASGPFGGMSLELTLSRRLRNMCTRINCGEGIRPKDAKSGWHIARLRPFVYVARKTFSFSVPVLVLGLARIIHERFYFNCGLAAATSLRAECRHAGGRARRSVGQHTVSSMLPSLTAPRARLATRLHNFATNHHE